MATDHRPDTASEAIFQCCNEIAKAIDENAAKENSDCFDAKLGPGKGDKATADFLSAVNTLLRGQFEKGVICSEKPIYERSNSKFDFYIPGEQTVVEVALSLRNPTTEFEKDILKVLVFNQKHSIEERIKKLIFIGKVGAEAKCREALRVDMINWAFDTHQLKIEVKDIQTEL